MTKEKKEAALSLFQQEVNANDISPIRNRHNFSVLTHNEDNKSLNIPINYEEHTEVKDSRSKS